MLYPCSTELLAHPSLVGSKVYFFWSPTEDYYVTVWWIWFVFVDYQVSVWSALSSVIGTFSPHQITPDTSDTDLIVDKHKSDSSDCDTIVFRRWPDEVNLASDEWRMSQKPCGTGVLDSSNRENKKITWFITCCLHGQRWVCIVVQFSNGHLGVTRKIAITERDLALYFKIW